MFLAGCVTLPRGYAAAELESSIRERLKEDFKIPVDDARVQAIQVTTDTLVTLDEAVGIALSNNPSIRIFYAELSIAKAEAVGAMLPDNPILRGEFLVTSDNAGEKTAIAVSQDLVDLLLMPLKKRVAKGRIDQRRLYIAHKILDAVVEVKTSYLGYQRDLQILELHRSVVATAEAEAELSKRQFGEGNINALDLARHQDVLHDAKLELIRAEAEVRHSKELVRRLLSFDTDGDWTVEKDFPGLPSRVWTAEELLVLGHGQRLDLAAAEKRVEVLKSEVPLARFNAVIDVEAGIGREEESDQLGTTGPEIGIALPLFDRGQADASRLRFEIVQAENQVEAIFRDIEREILTTHSQLQTERESTEYYRQVILPMKRNVLEAAQAHYNFMLIGVYDLLQAKKDQISAQQRHIETLAEYWIRYAELEQAVGGALPVDNATQH